MNVIEGREKTMEVLLVEDNPGDARLAREAFLDINKSIRMHLASGRFGSDGVSKAAGCPQPRPAAGSHPAGSEPPQNGWREVLARIKGDESLKMIPTIVLSSSETDAGRFDKLSNSRQIAI